MATTTSASAATSVGSTSSHGLVAINQIFRADVAAPVVLPPSALLAGDQGLFPGDSLHVVSIGQPTVTFTNDPNPSAQAFLLPSTGALVFEHSLDAPTFFQFPYTVADEHGLHASATITVEVLPELGSGGAEARPDQFTDTLNTPLHLNEGSLTANDSTGPFPLSALYFGGVANAQEGTVSFNPSTGGVTFTPQHGFTGVAGFDYFIGTGDLGSVGHVQVTVNGSAPAPSSTYTIAKATTLTVPPPGLDSATPGDTLQLVANVDHGSLTLGGPASFLGPGAFSYTPNAAYVGTDSFSYRDTATGQTTTVVINVTPPINNAPVANNDLYADPNDTTLQITAAHGVLANDTDPHGKSLTAQLVGGPTEGSLSLAANGGFTYTPAQPGANLFDHFTYVASNGSASSPPQTVWITNLAAGLNAAVNDAYTVPANQPSNVAPNQGVLMNDTDNSNIGIASFATGLPQHGTVSLAPDGGFEYIPTTGFAGQDHFSYIVSNGAVGNLGTVTLNVDPHAAVTILG